jgi:hypothetical protein
VLYTVETCHSSSGWEVLDQDTGRSSVSGGGPFPGSQTGAVFSQGGGDEQASWGLCYKGTNPVNEASTLMT